MAGKVRSTPVIRGLTALLAVAALSAAGCTAVDRFKLAEPQGAVTLIDGPHAAAAPGGGDCVPGTVAYWGSVRNTGDMDVEDVRVQIDVFAGDGSFLGRFSDSVYSGEVVQSEDGSTTSSTSLVMDQAGTFLVCTTVGFGAAARAEVQTEFVPVLPEPL